MVVAQVRADHNQRFRAAPQAFQHLIHLLRCGISDHQRHECEIIQSELQKRQLHFQAVLRRVRQIEHPHLCRSSMSRQAF